MDAYVKRGPKRAAAGVLVLNFDPRLRAGTRTKPNPKIKGLETSLTIAETREKVEDDVPRRLQIKRGEMRDYHSFPDIEAELGESGAIFEYLKDKRCVRKVF